MSESVFKQIFSVLIFAFLSNFVAFVFIAYRYNYYKNQGTEVLAINKNAVEVKYIEHTSRLYRGKIKEELIRLDDIYNGRSARCSRF